jgi:hypothetical protein
MLVAEVAHRGQLVVTEKLVLRDIELLMGRYVSQFLASWLLDIRFVSNPNRHGTD